MLIRRTSLLAKIESGGYGVDPSPVASDGILVSNLSLKPGTEVIKRDYYRDSLSPLAHVKGEKWWELLFTVEIKGGGAATTPPLWGKLVRACGMQQTIGGSNVTYGVESDPAGHESITFYTYKDGILYELNGCRGNPEFILEAGRLGMINFAFQGLYLRPVDAAIVNATGDTVIPPVVKGLGFDIGAYAAKIARLQLNLANTMTRRRDANQAEVISGIEIVGRDTNGSMDPESVT